jgi:hypothetical protein
MDPELEEFASEAQRRQHLREEHARRRAAALTKE